jgi:beta-xylosidase
MSNVRGIIEAADLAGQQSGVHRDLEMKKADLFTELVATYGKHGWRLKGVLMQPSTRAEIFADHAAPPDSIRIEEASVDALWFSRPSHQKREAWELRLMAETQYALFETFEGDETEEQRDEARREMEARLRDYVSREKG